jgi:hypothetical protein
LANQFSFIHYGNESMASYRYRTKIPATLLEIPINKEADIYILSKPTKEDLEREMFIADFCDDHFEWDHYLEILQRALLVTCPTENMREVIKRYGRNAIVIPDPYEYPLEVPHCNGGKLLWYGHGSNTYSLIKLLPEIDSSKLRVVSNLTGTIPWSWEAMLREFRMADIVLMPATKEYKSPNRTIEAIRQGCFVVAEPHPSINDFPIFIGDIKEGIEWAKSHQQEANEMILKAQKYIEKFSPRTVANAWKKTLDSASTLVAAKSVGLIG